ncbi:MAG: RNA polymerase sigma factor, partial [Bacteroidota bacterium]
IKACREGNRAGQRKLYELYFSYAMSIALRYTSNRTEAEEVLNDGFYKVFAKIDQYDPNYEFKKWLRSILVNSSIDYFRKYKKYKTEIPGELPSVGSEKNVAWENLLYEDILKHIKLLPPSYRVVFNLYAIDGYKHHEIAEQLNISIGTSKSNYSRARHLLQNYLSKSYDLKRYRNGQ